jgi:hypothetical protein
MMIMPFIISFGICEKVDVIDESTGQSECEINNFACFGHDYRHVNRVE